MDAFSLGAGKAHVRRLRFECCMLQTAWEDTEGLVRWRDMRCEEDPDDFQTLRHSVWKVTDFAREDAVLLLPPAAEVNWERPAQMLDALDLASVKEELGGDGLVKLGKVWGYFLGSEHCNPTSSSPRY